MKIETTELKVPLLQVAKNGRVIPITSIVKSN
jgi:hypothetical protein